MFIDDKKVRLAFKNQGRNFILLGSRRTYEYGDMPIANNVKKSLLDFYENSDTNVYDDYGDDFEADSDHGSSLDDAKETEKNSKYIERETTNNTEKSVLFKKRTERTLTASAGYTNNNRMAHSSSLTPRTKPAGRRPEKSRTLTGSSMKKGNIAMMNCSRIKITLNLMCWELLKHVLGYF